MIEGLEVDEQELAARACTGGRRDDTERRLMPMGKRGAIYTEFCYDLTDNSLLPGGQDQRARTATRPDAVHRVRPGPTPTSSGVGPDQCGQYSTA